MPRALRAQLDPWLRRLRHQSDLRGTAMIVPAWFCGSLGIAARGEADEERREAIDPQARATIRYADAAAWITATAAANALAEVGEPVSEMRPEVGVVTVSDDGPGETMAAVAEAAAAGFSSPMRYPAANPGSLAGVLCIAFGLRGPTLNLTMKPEDALPVVFQAAAGWLDRGVMPFLLVASCRRTEDGYRSRCLLLSRRDSAPRA